MAYAASLPNRSLVFAKTRRETNKAAGTISPYFPNTKKEKEDSPAQNFQYIFSEYKKRPETGRFFRKDFEKMNIYHDSLE